MQGAVYLRYSPETGYRIMDIDPIPSNNDRQITTWPFLREMRLLVSDITGLKRGQFCNPRKLLGV